MKNYTVIGLMSGTSLDGLDLACCNFQEEEGRWKFEVMKTETLPYNAEWVEKLSLAHLLPEDKLKALDLLYGKYLAEKTSNFIKHHDLNPDFIASHGHTIYHEPQKGITFQIGNGNEMAKMIKLPVVNDFRSLDVSLGGQGAPLVPVGDKLLFPDFDFCLNLGGFANVSFDLDGNRLAYDICPTNMALNYLSRKLGLNFDKNGELASGGSLNTRLFDELNHLNYYTSKAPKSLSREWFESYFMPIISRYKIPTIDLLHTITEHIAVQITNSFGIKNKGKALITGGGAHNSYLIHRLENLNQIKLVVPNNELIDFKEAIVFAFLGILKMRGEINCLKSVTGASQDNCGGQISFP